MKTDGTTDVLPLTKKQKYLTKIVMGALLLAAGVILILSGVGVIKASVNLLAAPTILFAVGLGILFSAIIAKNALSMWIAGVLLCCGLVSLLDVTTAATYSNLYPVYIALPGLGCLFDLVFAENKASSIKVAAFFIILGGLFALGSFGVCPYGLVGGLVAAYIGVVIITCAVISKCKKKADKSERQAEQKAESEIGLDAEKSDEAKEHKTE